VHAAQGNAYEAIRQYRLCCRMLRSHGVEPSEQMEALIRTLGQPNALLAVGDGS
jgi:hypothetical protein